MNLFFFLALSTSTFAAKDVISDEDLLDEQGKTYSLGDLESDVDEELELSDEEISQLEAVDWFESSEDSQQFEEELGSQEILPEAP